MKPYRIAHQIMCLIGPEKQRGELRMAIGAVVWPTVPFHYMEKIFP